VTIVDLDTDAQLELQLSGCFWGKESQTRPRQDQRSRMDKGEWYGVLWLVAIALVVGTIMLGGILQALVLIISVAPAIGVFWLLAMLFNDMDSDSVFILLFLFAVSGLVWLGSVIFFMNLFNLPFPSSE